MLCANPQRAEPAKNTTIANLQHDLAAVEIAEFSVNQSTATMGSADGEGSRSC